MNEHDASSAPNAFEAIVRIILGHYPSTQGIYLFGTYGMPDEWPDSDVDIAVLLSPEEAPERPRRL